MSHKHANLMRSIFQDPLPANLHWREIESLLNHLGAEIEPAHGARFRITLNKVEAFLHHPHNSSTCSRSDIKTVREFLAHAGVTLAAYEAQKE
nr:type II toxin-antitoxin system HicA family toxin [Dechloromonas sp.]